MYRIWNGLARFRPRPPATPAQSSRNEDGDQPTQVSTHEEELDKQSLHFSVNNSRYRSIGIRKSASSDALTYRIFGEKRQRYEQWNEYDWNIRHHFWDTFAYSSAAAFALARLLSGQFFHDKAGSDKDRREKNSSFCAWKRFKETHLKKSLEDALVSAIHLPQATVNSVLPKLPGLHNPYIAHAAVEQNQNHVLHDEMTIVRNTGLAGKSDTVQSARKKSVRIHPKFLKKDSASESSTESGNTFSLPELSEDDVAEFSSSTKHCVGLSYNIKGTEHFKAGDYKLALEMFVLGAAEGNPNAQFNLAQCYELGKGTDVNIQKAEAEYRKASLQGHKWAQYNLALMYLKEKDSDVRICLAHHLLHTAAKQGMVQAQSLLGALLAQAGKHHNMKNAVEMFDLASAQGDTVSTYHLGQCYEHGLGGLPLNSSHAYHLYASAANDGHLEAQFKMASILDAGCEGVDQNQQLAEELFKKAARRGHPKSKERYQKLVRERTRNAQSVDEASAAATDYAVNTKTSELMSLIMPGLLRAMRSEYGDFDERHSSQSSLRDDIFLPSGLHRQLIAPHMHRVATWPRALGKD